MITSEDLASLRRMQEDAMPERCEVQRKTVSVVAGARVATWNTVQTTMCRRRASGKEPQEREIAERMGSVVAYTISLPALTDVKASDRLLVGGVTYEIGGVLRSSHETARRCVCKEIE